MDSVKEVLVSEGSVPWMSATLSKAVTKTVDIFQSPPAKLKLTDTDDNVIVLINPDTRPALTSSNKNWSLLCFANGWARPKLDIKPPISVLKKQSVFANNTVRTDTRKALLKAGASASDHSMKDEDVMNEVETAVLLNLSKEENTTMIEDVNEMALHAPLSTLNTEK